MLKIIKNSHDVIGLDTSGNITFSNTYREEQPDVAADGELRISYVEKTKLATVPVGDKTDTLLNGRLSTNAEFPGKGLSIKTPNGQIAAEIHPDGDLYIKGTVTNKLTNPALPGNFSYSKIVYASPGLYYGDHLTQYKIFREPSGDYLTRPRDISDFAVVSGVGWPFTASNVPINGLLRVPDGDGPFPLVLFAHGNHSPYENSTPGYIYLCELLASHGIIAGSIDCNFLNGGRNENDGRAIIHLEHILQFKTWNEQEGHPLYNKIDMEHIMIAGHSRGGEAVGHAGYFNTLAEIVPDEDDPPVPLDGSQGLGSYGFNIKAIAAIAPTDSQYIPVTGRTVVRDNYFLIHGSRDNDVFTFGGYRTYDRAHPAGIAEPGKDAEGFKSLLWVYGANHNYFNSVWKQESSDTITRDQQEHIAKIYINALALAVLKNQSQYLDLLKGHQTGYSNHWFPGTLKMISQYQDKQRVFIAHYEEDENMNTISSPASGSADVSGIDAEELFFNLGYSSHLYQETRGVKLDYNGEGSFYVINIDEGGLDTGKNQALVLRIGQSAEENNMAGKNQDFTIVISDGTHTYSLTASSIAPLPYPGQPTRSRVSPKTVMQTLRIPLRLLADNGVDVSNIRQITLLFDRPIEGTETVRGTLYLDEIHLSK